jgi:hypothetical protein
VKQIKKDTTKRENFSLSLLPIFSPLFPLLKKRGREGEERGKKKGKNVSTSPLVGREDTRNNKCNPFSFLFFCQHAANKKKKKHSRIFLACISSTINRVIQVSLFQIQW